MLTTIGLYHFLVLGALLFSLGLVAVLTRKNAIAVLMGVELILNASNVNLLAFSRYVSHNLEGHIFSVFVIVIAAAEAVVALAIVLNISNRFHTIDVPEISTLKN